MEVYDLAGRLVRQLMVPAGSVGPVTVAWDGRDTRGLDAASGVYLFRLVTDRVAGVRRAVLVR